MIVSISYYILFCDVNMTTQKKDFIFEPFRVTEVKYQGFDCPRPRPSNWQSKHSIACDEAKLYCFGSFCSWPNPTGSFYYGLWSFSIATRKWTNHKIAKMPDEDVLATMCMYGKYLMIFGSTDDLWHYDNNLFIWHTNRDKPRMDILEVAGTRPPYRCGQATMCHNGYFYTVGGLRLDPLGQAPPFVNSWNIYRLDLRTLKWETLFVDTEEEGPRGRWRHGIIRDGNKFYLIGGRAIYSNYVAIDLMEIPMYDLENHTWQIVMAKPDESGHKPLIPFSRESHSTVQINTPNGVQVFIAGGSNGQSVCNDIWRLNIADMQWTLMKKTVLPKPLSFHSASVTASGCMFIFGGECNGIQNNILYRVWICIPKLSEICFEAILNLNPNIVQVDKTALLGIGIPKHFAQRLHP